MKITKVCCQGCGADLDISDGIRFVTCNHCGSRLEVVHDASVTHTRQLERIEQTTRQMVGNLKVIELQNDLELLDREWAMQREQYMVRNKDGSTSEPGSAGAMIGSIIAIVFGVFWIIAASSAGAPGFFPLFGLVFIAFAIFGMVSGSSKSHNFNSAQSVYQQRRDRLLAEINQERNTQS